MRMHDIIVKKRDGGELTRDEIEFAVGGFVAGKIPDYEMSALLMAIYFQKMSSEETANLTMSMAKSGATLDLPISTVDKHSTGGVGDKVSIVLAPLVAAAGVPLAKSSGRGLGHTGGTIDKLASIPGFRTDLRTEEFTSMLEQHNIALMQQTENFAPADKLLYALRDVTGTVENISLIASSIMSKKIALGASAILLDVKVGSGAFMKTIKEARALAREMISIGNTVGRKVVAVLSNMEQPLGYAVGNSLEVIEAIRTLHCKGPDDLTELCLTLGSNMLVIGGLVRKLSTARKIIEDTLISGAALAKMREWVEAQGGDVSYINDISLFPKANKMQAIFASRDAFISGIDAYAIGKAAMLLGAGREHKEDNIDLSAGILLKKKIGDFVRESEVIALAYTNKNERPMLAEEIVENAFSYSDTAPALKKLIIETISG